MPIIYIVTTLPAIHDVVQFIFDNEAISWYTVYTHPLGQPALCSILPPPHCPLIRIT